jgi:aryl-alcohol dehydrogenase-like predicted oxidoreductase
MSMTPIYGKPDPDEAIATVHRALELGVNHIDSSDAYAGGTNEELLARAIAGKRDQVLLATKFGQVRHPDGSMEIAGSPDYVRSACEASLKRLDTDYIDLYYQHRVDTDVPIEDTIGAMAELKQQGKIRALGMSEAHPDTIRRALKVHDIAAVQIEYSLWTRFVEQEHLPLCHDNNIGFVAYSPIGRGFLSGSIRSADDLAPEADGRAGHPRFQADSIEKNVSLLKPIEDMAAAKGCTMAQLAIAWVNCAGDDIFPLPGSGKRAHLEENVKAAEIELSAAERAQLAELVIADDVEGERYPPAMMKIVNV